MIWLFLAGGLATVAWFHVVSRHIAPVRLWRRFALWAFVFALWPAVLVGLVVVTYDGWAER